MQTNTQLRAVEELDDLEAAQAAVAAVNKRLTERRSKLADLEKAREQTEREIRDSAVSGDVAALGSLSETKARLADAVGALTEHAIPALEAERDSAQGRVGEIQRARNLAALRARVEPEREAMRLQRLEVAARLNGALDALVEYARLGASFSGLREGLSFAGEPVAAEPSTREVLRALGCGRGAPFRVGFEFVPVPVPTSALS